ncbi:PfkB family carbohydrate kinase [Halalkalibacter krulwichiae]|uniref:5-dehydro-2-deoxygluconokinase n=1 Tax=Halalkalibacter krulwichiae TaxID=199441 RepID=A0A1X9MEY0_9BACI|nr:PfkB family carbohydrate kinase [Halalkalibacter krulwichiae]ARK30081.1 5-dehydro-2-deoxygluconokinase [Halalkalibacter krulwichiae]
MGKVISLGELLIDFMPKEKGKSLKEVVDFEKAAGGAPANVAAAIAKLGGRASFIGKVGNDAFGHFLEEELQNAGVDTRFLVKSDVYKTALAFVSNQANGERDFMFYRDPSADMMLTADEIEEAWFEKGDIYHFGSVSLIDHPVKEATAQALSIAETKGAIISFDPNVRLPLWDQAETAKECIRRYFNRAHIVKVSEEELFFLTGVKKEQEAVLTLFGGANKLVLVTKGSKGSSVYTAGSMLEVEAVKVDAQDTTGAGDAFVGGLLYFLQNESKQIDLEAFLSNETKVVEMVQFAGKCGAITTTRRGAIPALPALNDVK